MSLSAITDALKSKVSGMEGFGSSIKFNFGGETVLLDGTGSTIEVSNEDKDAACTISVSTEDFQDLLSGNLDPMSAFMGGKIRVEGDMTQAMKLQQFLG